MRAAEYLKQIQKFECIIKNKLEEKERWMAMATNVSAHIGGERVQSSGSQQKMADAVIESVDIEKQIAAEVSRLIQKRNDIMQTIEQLDIMEYEFIYKVYVENLSLKEVAGYFCRSYGWATDFHRKTLRKVQIIIDAKKEAI